MRTATMAVAAAASIRPRGRGSACLFGSGPAREPSPSEGHGGFQQEGLHVVAAAPQAQSHRRIEGIRISSRRDPPRARAGAEGELRLLGSGPLCASATTSGFGPPLDESGTATTVRGPSRRPSSNRDESPPGLLHARKLLEYEIDGSPGGPPAPPDASRSGFGYWNRTLRRCPRLKQSRASGLAHLRRLPSASGGSQGEGPQEEEVITRRVRAASIAVRGRTRRGRARARIRSSSSWRGRRAGRPRRRARCPAGRSPASIAAETSRSRTRTIVP